MSEATTEANAIETWAIVEIMGHQRLAGFARTQAFGGTVMLRVDVPDLPAREDTQYGQTYAYDAEPGHTQYVGMGSIYRLTPCTESTARAAADRMRKLPARALDVPATRRLEHVASDADDDRPFGNDFEF